MADRAGENLICGGLSGCRLRAAAEGDVAALAALDARCNPHPWPARHFQAALRSPRGTVWLAEDAAGVQGLAVWQQAADEMELHLIATAPEYRRRGIAAALMRQMLRAAQEGGAARIFLEVRAGNLAARALYLRHGFTETAVRPRYYGSEDAVLMEKTC